jgi:hypothetical protein
MEVEPSLLTTDVFFLGARHSSARGNERTKDRPIDRSNPMDPTPRTPTKSRDEGEDRGRTRRGRRLFAWHALVGVVAALATANGREKGRR